MFKTKLLIACISFVFASIFLFSCAAQQERPASSQASVKEQIGPPYFLTVSVIDDLGVAAINSFVRIMECCHTQAGPCGRIPVDTQGQVRVAVCPERDGIVRVTLTPDPTKYRVPPVSEFDVHGDTSVKVTVTRHENALRHLQPTD